MAHSGEGGGRWYFSRKEIEENSPSRRDGIDLKKEAILRDSYCTFLRDLGITLKVPQVTIATAMIFCHRFFLRQSHARNDRRIIASACMFLAGKVEETPRPLKDVILVSYEIIHNKDPAAAKQRIKQKEVYEQQKELILLGERVVLATLGFDLNVHHPYKPLVDAINKFKVSKDKDFVQVAWNFVNDGIKTSLCFQFMPHHIASGAIFLAAKFRKVKLPSDGEKVWWQEFDVTPVQLEEVSNQMLEMYYEPASHDSSHGVTTSKAASSRKALSQQNPDQTHVENHIGASRITQTRVDSGNSDINGTRDDKGDDEDDNGGQQHWDAMPKKSRYGIEGHKLVDCETNAVGDETRDSNSEAIKDAHQVRKPSNKDATLGLSPQDTNKKLDREKLKAVFECRKALGEISHKVDPKDELERELEDNEVPGPSEKSTKQNWPRSSNNKDAVNDYGYGNHKYSNRDDFDMVEEWEMDQFDDAEKGYKSSMRKRKLGGYQEERDALVRHGYSDRDYKRQRLQENHV